MKIIVNSNHLYSALQRIVRFTSRKSVAILKTVLIETSGDGIQLSSSNLDMGVTLKIGATVTTPGSILVMAETLFDIIKNLGIGCVTIEKIEDKVEIVSGLAKFTIAGLNPKEFPPLPTNIQGFETVMDQAELGLAIKEVICASSEDETRYILCGVFFEFTNVPLLGSRLIVTATDGRRIATKTINLPQEVKTSS